MSVQGLQIDIVNGRSIAGQYFVIRTADQDVLINRYITSTHPQRQFSTRIWNTSAVPIPKPFQNTYLRDRYHRDGYHVGNVFRVEVKDEELAVLLAGQNAPTSLTQRIRISRVDRVGKDTAEWFKVYGYDIQPSLDEIFTEEFWSKKFQPRALVKPVAPIIPSVTTLPTAPVIDDGRVKPGTKIDLAGGGVYIAREIEGLLSDVQLLRDARKNRLYTLLESLPGTGKTMACKAAFGDELLTVQCDGDTTSASFVGTWVPTSQQGVYDWVDGPLTVAMREGRPLLIDEMFLADSRALAVVLSAMDDRRELNVTDNPSIGTIKAKDGFFIVGAYNASVPGIRVSEAGLSRFRIPIAFTTDYKIMKTLGVPSTLITACRNLDKKRKSGEIATSPQAREMLGYVQTAKVFGETVALRALIQSVNESDRDVVALALATTIGTTVTPLSTN